MKALAKRLHEAPRGAARDPPEPAHRDHDPVGGRQARAEVGGEGVGGRDVEAGAGEEDDPRAALAQWI